jgi:hypothetical protein
MGKQQKIVKIDFNDIPSKFKKLPREKTKIPSKICPLPTPKQILVGNQEKSVGLDLSSFPADSPVKPKKKLFGFLGKKEKIERPVRKEMTELELLEVEIEQKRILLKQKKEEELRKKLEEEQKKKELERQKQKEITIRTNGKLKKGMSASGLNLSDKIFPSNEDNINLIPDNNEIDKFCSQCGKKLKRKKIIVNGNVYNQELICKKCGFVKTLEMEI